MLTCCFQIYVRLKAYCLWKICCERNHLSPTRGTLALWNGHLENHLATRLRQMADLAMSQWHRVPQQESEC